MRPQDRLMPIILGQIKRISDATDPQDAVPLSQVQALIAAALAGVVSYAPLQVPSETPPEFVLTPDGEVVLVPV